MKKYSIILFGLVLLCYACDKTDLSSEQKESFVKFYGTATNDQANDLYVSENGYNVVGSTRTSENKDQICLLITDFYGNQTDLVDFGGPFDDWGASICKDFSSGFVLLGTYQDTTNTDIVLYNVDASGNQLWEKRIGGDDNETASKITKLDDGYLIIGSTDAPNDLTNNPRGSKDILLLKLDNQGETVWEKVYGGSNHDEGVDMVTYYNGFTILANTESFADANQSGKNIMLIQTTLEGYLVDMYTYGGTDDDIGAGLGYSEDGTYYIAGTTNSVVAGNSQLYLLHIDTDIHNILLEESYGEALMDYGYDVLPVEEGMILVGSFRETEGDAAYYLKLDYDGNILDERKFGGIGTQQAKCIKPVFDQGYIITGNSGYEENLEMCLIRIKAD